MTEPTPEEVPTEESPSVVSISPRKMSPELRLTVVEQIYYQQPGVDAITIEAGYSYFVQENEQAFQRISFADEEWKPLELAWIKKASCIVIQNRYAVETRRNLSEEEKVEAAKHIIQVRFDDSQHCMEIGPKESMRFKTSSLTSLQIRSAFGSTRYICNLIPE